jgi:glycosyltransferase involved in cell wall biosynthesis
MLSFLIPAYNCEDVIDEAVESALGQALDLDAEVVIVDDGSTDSTAQHARSWEARSPGRVRLGFHERNRGGAATRNTAASLATGNLLYMLDADNVLTEGCVASQLALMRETGLDAVSVGQLYYFEGSTANVTDGWVQRHTNGRSTVRHLFETTKVPPSHGNYLYTRRLFEAVGGYPEDAAAMDTWTFGLKHLAGGFEIGIDTRSRYLHRLNRPDRESYWSREERAGTNDVNAIRALRREIDNLPEDLRELVMALTPRDRFFALALSGAFRSDPAHFRDVRRLERVERRALIEVRRLPAIAARVRGWMARR